MAKMHELSDKLKAFKEAYSKFTAIKTPQSEINTAINDAANQMDSAINGFSSASSDNQCAQLKACVSLVKSAADVVKSHVDGDLSALLANGEQVNKIITDIESKIEAGNKLDEKVCVKKADPNNGIPNDVYEDNPEVKKYNDEIDMWNKKGEAQLVAMSTAINSVAFGVIGNMKQGGTLGNSVLYADNYKFNDDDYVVPAGEQPKVDDDGKGRNDGSGGNDQDGDNPAGDNPAGDNPAGDNPAGDNPAGDNPAGDNPDGDNPADEPQAAVGWWDKVSGRYVYAWEDLAGDVSGRWQKVDDVWEFLGDLAGTVWDGVEFGGRLAVDTQAAVRDTLLSGGNWVFDWFTGDSTRSGTTEQYWQNIGKDFGEDWYTFGEYDVWWKYPANGVLGLIRSVPDVVQLAGNAAVSLEDWIYTDFLPGAVDWVGHLLFGDN